MHLVAAERNNVYMGQTMSRLKRSLLAFRYQDCDAVDNQDSERRSGRAARRGRLCLSVVYQMSSTERRASEWTLVHDRRWIQSAPWGLSRSVQRCTVPASHYTP